MRLRLFTVILAGLLISAGLVSANVQAVDKKGILKTISSNLESLRTLPGVISSVKSPEVTNPEWLQAELDAESAAKVKVAAALAEQQAAARAVSVVNSTVTYDVATRGTITADLSEFKFLANQALNDARGWSRMGVNFQEVASGGNFTLVLSEASQVPSFYPSICSIYWSCTVGRYVIINQDRWLYASDSWDQAGGSLRDYRNMVINHETGHWLGHSDDNSHCGGSGQSAPVMQQQSIDLLGCSFNPWPLDSELWSSQLGIGL
jgi:hypothetical protein